MSGPLHAPVYHTINKGLRHPGNRLLYYHWQAARIHPCKEDSDINLQPPYLSIFYPPSPYLRCFFITIHPSATLRKKHQPSHGLIHSLLSFFSGEKHRSRIRCHAFLRRKNLLNIRSCFPSGISGTGKIHTARTRYSPALPVTDSRSYSLRKEPHLLHICSCCFLRRKRQPSHTHRRKRLRRKNVGINI